MDHDSVPFNAVTGSSGRSLSDAALRQLLDLIRSGVLPPGSKLPPERDLAVRLDVSRTALREALVVLQAVGLVDARVGRGRFVSQEVSEDRSAFLIANWVQMHRAEVAELNELRQIIESRVVRGMPADRIEPCARKAHGVVEQASAALSAGSLDEAAELEAEFHRTLVTETSNRPLRVLAFGLIEAASGPAEQVYEDPERAQRSVDQHREIAEILATGDLDAAAEAVISHHDRSARLELWSDDEPDTPGT